MGGAAGDEGVEEKAAMNEGTFCFGVIVGFVMGAGMTEFDWPGWTLAAVTAFILGVAWLGKDYLDARRCRKQRRIEMEASKED